jgi:pyruvate dehydrogenase E2 component (dihydrolipoamide acetyltransferase)
MSDVTMPQLGETVTEGTITKWFKKIGDTVERDELLFEVSTDKVDSEVTSPAAGVLTEIRVIEGATVDVGSVLAVISDGAAAPVVTPPAPEPVPVAAAPVAPQVAPQVAAPPAVAPPAAVAPAAPAPMGVAPAEVVQPSVLTPAAASAEGFAKVLSPVVRKLINDNNLDPNSITGTGIGGRVTREDVIAVIESGAGTPAPAVAVAAPVAPAPVAVAPAPVAPAPVAPAAVAAPPVAAAPVASVAPIAAPVPAPLPAAAPAVVARSGRDDVVPFSNIRRRTGEHMVMSLSTAPHAFIAAEIDFSNVDRVRNKRKETWKAEEGFSLTYLPFIARAVVEAMVQYPNVNASVSGDSLIVHRGVNLGIAVDLDFQGLLVPVVRDADGKRMRAIARDIADVAGRARTKKLVADDLVGGTFTISNAGPYGIDLMSSIINQPQVAILSTTAVKKRPVVVELPDGGDTIAIHPTGWIGFSWDHRAFDGAYAASFLAKVKELLETRDWNSEL